MSSLLEQRYRRALRLLPAAYRREWEADMVATFLERAHAANPDDPEGVELSRPGRGELASIAGLAVRLRLGGPDAAPRSFAWGEAARRIALVGLLAHTIAALVGVVYTLWIIQRLPGATIPSGVTQVGFPSQWQALWSLTGLLWLPAYLSLLYGHRRAAGLLALLALAPVLISTVVDLAADGGAFAATRSYWLLFGALPVLALAAFHHEAPPVTPRPWLLALPAGVVGAFTLPLLSAPAGEAPPLVDWPALWCIGLAGATLVHLTAPRTGLRLAGPHWTLALAVLAAAAFGLRTVTLLDHVRLSVPLPYQGAYLALGVAEAGAMLAAAVVLAVLAHRALRRLPTAAGAEVIAASHPR